MKRVSAELVLDCKDSLGEGLFWDVRSQRLHWVDIGVPSRLHGCGPDGGNHRVWPMPEMISYAVTRASGGMLIASHGGLNSFGCDSGEFKRICQIEKMRPFNRSNDACCDPAGRLWVGTMQNNIAPDNSMMEMVGSTGGLYRIGPDLRPEQMLDGIGISNSTCFAPDGRTMYFCDTLQDVIWQFDFDPASGSIANRRDFARHDSGHPDGSTVDAEGGVWNARFDGGCVIRFAPDGSVDAIVSVPTSEVTCCTFGGSNLDILFITSKRLDGKDPRRADEPHSGGLFAAVPGVKGVADVAFAG